MGVAKIVAAALKEGSPQRPGRRRSHGVDEHVKFSAEMLTHPFEQRLDLPIVGHITRVYPGRTHTIPGTPQLQPRRESVYCRSLSLTLACNNLKQYIIKKNYDVLDLLPNP